MWGDPIALGSGIPSGTWTLPLLWNKGFPGPGGPARWYGPVAARWYGPGGPVPWPRHKSAGEMWRTEPRPAGPPLCWRLGCLFEAAGGVQKCVRVCVRSWPCAL